MNAAELLLASHRRKASRKHDRVYGIMGAIGVNITVTYEDDASEVMDRFLLKLHEELPVEIQAFLRDGPSRPDTRHWLIDDAARLLTLVRQNEPPRPSVFKGISEDGELCFDKVERLGANGVAELKGCVLSLRAVMASDRPAFRQFTNVKETGGEATYYTHLSHLCIILESIASCTDICLAYFGTVSGLEPHGLREAYLVLTKTPGERLGSTCPDNTASVLTRLGYVISADRFSYTESVEGRFVMN